MIASALRSVYQECHGSFACVVVVDSNILLGFRDPWGIKPLVLGQRRAQDGSCDYMLASESVALEKLDFHSISDVRPGTSGHRRWWV